MSFHDVLWARRDSWRVVSTLLLAVLVGCGGGKDAGEEESQTPDSEIWEGDVVAAARTMRTPGGTDWDWETFRTTVTGAWEEGFDTIPMGEAMVSIGLTFLGTPYGPGTLEVAGEEDVVVNFQEFDCVTFVENVLAIARFIRIQDPSVLESSAQSREAYRGALREIRYRGARVNGYASRLHYFSDWISDNERMNLVQEVTQGIGGEEDYKAIDYMTTHPGAYRQLASMENLRAIEETEVQLSGSVRFKISEEDIRGLASEIKNGDIIAATSTVDGLDVAHTGLAFWQGAELHLLHTPLVGGAVEVSSQPLADRVLRQDRQDGIRVVRPLDPSEAGGGNPTQ